MTDTHEPRARYHHCAYCGELLDERPSTCWLHGRCLATVVHDAVDSPRARYRYCAVCGELLAHGPTADYVCGRDLAKPAPVPV